LQPRRIATIIIVSGGLGLGCLCMLGGCADETRTTGTQLQISPERKAMFGDMQKEMKKEKAELKSDRAARKKAQ